MAKRNYASVTEVACTCGYLEESARDPKLPIKFDAELNEYHIAGDVSPGGSDT